MHAKPTAVFSPAHVSDERRYRFAVPIPYIPSNKLQHDKLLRGDTESRIIVASPVVPSRASLCHISARPGRAGVPQRPANSTFPRSSTQSAQPISVADRVEM